MKPFISFFAAIIIITLTSAFLIGANTPTQDTQPQTVTRNNETVPNPQGFILKGLETRESRRAFFTAPPVIPHGIGATDAECISCHAVKREYKGVTSTLTPHANYINCQQCHVKGTPPAFVQPANPVTSTTWVGLIPPGKGTRAHDYAPPTIPHRNFLRENCNACHDKSHPRPTMKAPHGERANCAQCHVQMDLRLDF